MIRACIFDLDGTLLNTIKALSYCISRTMEQFGYGEIDEAHTKQFVGDGYKELVRRALIFSGDKELRHFEEACRLYLEIFAEHSLDEVAPYEGIEEVLEYLRKKNIRLAVLSNKPQAETEHNIIQIFGEGVFEKIYGQREGIPLKPDPRALELLMEELGVSRDEVLYFGDTSTDMQTGANAGVKRVAVLWGFRSEEELASFSPEHMLRTPREARGLI
ncbi:MAG: HAD family hydrolase [Johnsonella sp.]|nr:HAD family hydrolase [Johnsonella sp.]